MGNLDAIRDWEYAPEYGEGMWRMLQHSTPGDYILATNTGYSVREFLKFAFDAVNLDWEKYVRLHPRYQRPTEVDALIGDYCKSENFLGWKPRTFAPELAKIMVTAELRRIELS